MSNEEFQSHMKYIDDKLEKGITKEEALESLVRAGILNKKGNFTRHYPNLAKYDWENRRNKTV